MTNETWAIIGTMAMIGAIIVSLGAVDINQLSSRMDDLRTDINRQFDEPRKSLRGDGEKKQWRPR